jgi:tetratricopeptide (TPR) repeat protein
LRQALAIDPSMSDASNWLSSVLGHQDQHQEASEVLRRAYQIDPLHPAIAANYARQLRQRGEFEHAQQISLRLIESDPKSTYPYYDLVDEFERQGRLVEMLHMAQRAALSGASNEYWKIGRAYALLGDFSSAEYWIERTQRKFPGWPASPYLAAVFRYWQGRYVEAAAETEAVLKERGLALDEQHDWIAHHLGWNQALAGRYQRAIAVLESVPTSNGTSAIALQARQALAWSYLQTGQRENALPILQQLDEFFQEEKRQGRLAMFRTPSNSGSYLYALNTRMLGDNERALDLLQSAIDGGWRNYYIYHHDPRWDVVRGNSRFQRMMAVVKADVDAQRAQLEQEESPEDFVKRLERVRAGESAKN